jgi:adenylate cyclase
LIGRWRNAGLSTLVLILGLGIRVIDPSVIEDLQARSFDFMQQMKPRAYVPVPVRVIDIDDTTLTKLGQWPWPRTLMADLIDRLNRLHPAVIALDMILAEPDRTSPALAFKQLSGAPDDVMRWAASQPDHDLVFAQTIANAPVVTGFALTSDGGGRPPALKAGWSIAGDDPAMFVPGYGGAVTNLPEIEATAHGNGSLNLITSNDQVARSVPLLVRYENHLFPSLVAESLRVYQHTDSFLVKASGASGIISLGERTGIAGIRIGDLATEPDRTGALWLYDTGHLTRRVIPAWQIMDGSASASDLQGAIVFIGVGAAGLGDLKSTPLSASVPGVEVHAQIAEQVLLQNFLRRPDWAGGAEMFYLVALGLALIVGLPRFGAARSAAFTVAVVGAAFASSWYAFSELGLLFSPVYPSGVALCVYLSSSLVSHLETEADKRQIRHAFSHYLSPAVVEHLVKDPSKLRLSGELRNMTFLFSDIRGFTSLAEQYRDHPNALTTVVNRFMNRMTRAIFQYGGTIDKYMGDCVMAFWNAPVDDKDHPARACEAALAMRAELRLLNEELAAEAASKGGGGAGEPIGLRLEAGIGINTGHCIVGNLGSDILFNYSVLGDAVNLASRLEGESKNYGVSMIIGEDTEKLAPGFATLELDLVAVKGKREQTRIFALLGDRALGSDPVFLAHKETHAQFLAAYRGQQWRKARELMALCRSSRPDLAALYDLFAKKIAQAERQPLAAVLTAEIGVPPQKVEQLAAPGG